eukprot:Opistho-2@51243
MARKRITQETFNAVVEENIAEFGMTREEAVEDAKLQFDSQGVDLSNVVATPDVSDDGTPGKHPIAAKIESIKAALDNTECQVADVIGLFKELLEVMATEPGHRIVAGTNDCVRLCIFASHRFLLHEEFVAVSLDILRECLQVQANRDLIGKMASRCMLFSSRPSKRIRRCFIVPSMHLPTHARETRSTVSDLSTAVLSTQLLRPFAATGRTMSLLSRRVAFSRPLPSLTTSAPSSADPWST